MTDVPFINYKLLTEGCEPKRAHATDAGADLMCSNSIYLPQGERTLVPTGVSVEIPSGYVGLLIPRSSLSKEGITMTNSIGVIDAEYRGEIFASLMYNGEFVEKYLAKFTKIVQLVIMPIALPKFNKTEELSKTIRGSGGFGSTGA